MGDRSAEFKAANALKLQFGSAYLKELKMYGKFK